MTQFPLRMPEHVMEQARLAANEDGVSVNQMLVSLISEGLGHRRGIKMMRERAARGNQEAAIAILDKIEGLPPEPGDELPEEETGASFSPR